MASNGFSGVNLLFPTVLLWPVQSFSQFRYLWSALSGLVGVLRHLCRHEGGLLFLKKLIEQRKPSRGLLAHRLNGGSPKDARELWISGGGRAQQGPNVRYWPIADILTRGTNVQLDYRRCSGPSSRTKSFASFQLHSLEGE